MPSELRSQSKSDQRPTSAPLPRAVIALGWVSLLTDAASDMIYPLLPSLLLTIGGGATALGWIEGMAEGVAAAVKLISGRVGDRVRHRKSLVALGYGIAALARPLYALVSAPVHAVGIRMLDRVGKGLRGPPRDAMVADAVPREDRGRAFGLQRMMDNMGGVVGALLAFALLRFVELPVRSIFVASLVPGLLAVLVVILFVREPPRVDASASASAIEGNTRSPLPSPNEARARAEAVTVPDVNARTPPKAPLGAAAKRYLVALFLFSLAGSGDLFLLRRLTDLGLSVALAPIAWVSLQLAKALLNVPGGIASDRFGRRRVLAIAWLIYAVTYAAYGLVTSWPAAWLLLALYAIHYGLAEGGQRALLAEYVPLEARSRAYGIQLAVEGAVVLPANVLFGLAYDRSGAPYAFFAAGAAALLASVALVVFVPAPAAPAKSR